MDIDFEGIEDIMSKVIELAYMDSISIDQERKRYLLVVVSFGKVELEIKRPCTEAINQTVRACKVAIGWEATGSPKLRVSGSFKGQVYLGHLEPNIITSAGLVFGGSHYLAANQRNHLVAEWRCFGSSYLLLELELRFRTHLHRSCFAGPLADSCSPSSQEECPFFVCRSRAGPF